MYIRNMLAILLTAFLVPMAFAGSAFAAAGDACSGTVCGLGGQIRGQIGRGLPLPISIAPARTGAFVDITIQTQPATPSGLALRGLGLGQPGQIKPTVAATIMQTVNHLHTPNNPRNVTLAPAQFGYGPHPEGSIGVLGFNSAALAVRTNLIFDSPHPGTDGMQGTVMVPGGGGSRVLSAGGRPGLAHVSYCAGAIDRTPNGAPAGVRTPGNNFGGFCLAGGGAPAGVPAGINGVVKYTKTTNQFGGISTGRTLGTAVLFFNVNKALFTATPNGGAGNVPCQFPAEPLCILAISEILPGSTGVAGGPFGSTVNNPAFITPTGIFSADIGFNGTVLRIGNPILIPPTPNGVPIPFTGQDALSVGFPLTTGKITMSVTDALPSAEIFVRTGTDARTPNGAGVIALNTGAMSARPTTKGNANRTWLTLEIPEPSVIFAASAALFALFGCHQLVRRRSR